jgi:predicted  nucleic acid-binding Zn-ribbon protein
MSRKDIIDNINKFKRRISEHQEKIRNDPKDRTVEHWKKEISNFEKEILNLERQLNVASSEEYCPNCRRQVAMNGNKCTICRKVIM